MFVQKHNTNKVVISSKIGSAGYGCCFGLSEFNYKSIAMLLYLKICYDIRERVKEWVRNFVSLFRT